MNKRLYYQNYFKNLVSKMANSFFIFNLEVKFKVLSYKIK